MHIIFALFFIFLICFLIGFGISYFLFVHTQFEKIACFLSPLIGSLTIIISVTFFAQFNISFQKLIFIPILLGFFITLLCVLKIAFRNKSNVHFFWAKANIPFLISILFAFFAALLPLTSHIVKNQFGYFHLGNSEFMAYGIRAFNLQNNNINTIIVEQLDRYGVSLYLAFISSLIHKAPPLVVQLYSAFLRMILIVVSFGIFRFIHDSILKKDNAIPLRDYIALGAILSLSALEYEHFSLAFVATHFGMMFFLPLLLLAIYPMLLKHIKIAFFYGLSFTALIISYPEMAILVTVLLIGAIVIRSSIRLINIILKREKVKNILCFTEIVPWLTFCFFSLISLLIIYLRIIPNLIDYAFQNSSDFTEGFNILGNPITEPVDFLARGLGFQFWDFMSVSTILSGFLLFFGVLILGLIIYAYWAIANQVDYGILIFPLFFIALLFIGLKNGHFYHAAKFLFFTNTLSLILLLLSRKITRLKLLATSLISIFVFLNASAIYQHLKHYVIELKDSHLFTESLVKAIEQEQQTNQYKKEILINSTDPGLWLFFAGNRLTAQENAVISVDYKKKLYNFFQGQDNIIFINLRDSKSRFIDIDYGSQAIESIYFIFPEEFQNLKKNVSISPFNPVSIPKSSNQLLDNGNVITCNGGGNSKISRIVQVDGLSGRTVLFSAFVQAKSPSQAIIAFTDLNTGEVRRSESYATKIFLVTKIKDWQEGKKNMFSKPSEELIFLSYRIPRGTSQIEVGYEDFGPEPECALFRQMEIFVLPDFKGNNSTRS